MYTTYLAGFIEHKVSGARYWRDDVLEKLDSPDMLVYCPIKYEAIKTGKPAGEHVKYTMGLKQGGHWAQFTEEMKKIWWGIVRPGKNRFEVIKQFQYRKFIDGNKETDLPIWGDFEAVSRSDFIIVYYKRGVPSWGTPAEAVTAFFLDIPIYVISDTSKTKMNSSLLWWVQETKGDVFYSLNDCVKYIKDTYKLSGPKIEEKKDEKSKKEE